MSANPAVSDFAVTQAIDGGGALNVTPSVTSLDATGKIVTLTVPAVVATTAAQTVVNSVSYKSGASVAASAFTVPKIEVIAPVITATASVNVTANAQAYTFTVADEANGSGVDDTSLVVKQGTTTLVATALATPANTYQVNLNEVKGANQTLTIDVKDKAGNSAATASVALVDKVKPVITNVQALNNKTIVVTYSEPVSNAALTMLSQYAIYNKTNGATNNLIDAAPAGSANIQALATFANLDKTQIKINLVALGTAVLGYPQNGFANGGYILYGTGVVDTATVANTIVAASPFEFTGTLTPDTAAPVLLSASFNSASGTATFVFDKATTGVAPADDKVSFTNGTTSVLLKATDYDGAGTSTVIAGTSTVTFGVEAATLASINALGAAPQIVLAAGAFTDGTNATAAATSTPTITTGPVLTSVTYDENTNTVVYKFSKTINVTAITTFANKFKLGGVFIDANSPATFATTANGTDLTFVLSNADAQAIEALLRGGTLTASVVAAAVSDTAATPTANVAASSSATLVAGTTYTKDTTAPTLTSSKYNADTKVLELTFNEAVRNTIGDFVGASVELYKDDNGVAGLQTAVVSGVAADTKIATFADTDLATAVNNHAIIQTGLVTDATGAPAVAATKESATIYVKDSDGGVEKLDGSIDTALAVPKDVYVNILAGGVKDANTNVTTDVQTAKVTNVAVSNTTALTAATAIANVSLGEITVTFANAGGSVAMDTVTATNPANYDLYLVANPLNKVSIKNIEMTTNNTVARIFFNTPIAAGNYALKTSGLKTGTNVASNIDGTILPAELWTAAANGTVLDATQTLTLTDKDASGTVSAGDEVKVIFSEAVKLPAGLLISDITADNSHTLGNSTFALASDNRSFTLTLGSTSTLAVGDKLTFPVTVKDLENVALAAGAAQTTNAMTVTGNVAPKILSALYADTNADGVVSTGDVLTIKFDKNVQIATGKTAADLINDIVEGGTSFTAGSLAVDTLTLTVGTAAFAVGDSVDVNGTPANVDVVNSWGTAATTTAKAIVKSDVTAPTVTGFGYNTATRALTVTFNESVHLIDAGAPALAKVIAAKFTVTGGTLGTQASITGGTLSADKKSFSFILHTDAALDQFATITVSAGAFTDAGVTNVIEDASGNDAVRGQGTAYALTVTP